MLNLLRLSFIPQSADLGLLILRVSLGFSMLLLHGWVKVQNFNSIAPKFLPLFGLPSNISLAMAISAEVGCSVLLIVGLFTRIAALGLTVTMAVAFIMVHKWQLTGANPGELAYVYLAGYLTLLCAGAGKFSADGR